MNFITPDRHGFRTRDNSLPYEYFFKYTITSLFFVILHISPLCARLDYSPAIRQLLQRLDTVLAHKDSYVHSMEKKVRVLEEERNRHPLTDEQRYQANKRIYELLCVFNSDSVMPYVNENLKIAIQMHRNDRVAEWNINKSFILAATGLLKESYDILKEVNSGTLNRELRLQYYTQVVFLYSHMAAYLNEETSRLRNE